jgi:type I restriction enzyme S subunit
MSLRLNPYPEMKDSGVPWLGEVPEHWDVLPNRALFAEVNDRDHPDEQMLSVTITKGVIPQQALLEGSSKKDGSNQDKSAYKLVRPGDIAYNKMRAWQGAIGVSDLRGIVSPAYVVVRPRDKNSAAYFHHLFRTPQFAKEAERWSYGITSDMWSLRPEHFRMIYSVLPPREERTAAVRFLNQADKRIKRFIAAKRRLIELLNEQKQAIIQKAVTRGLDSNVRLKPSGVDWIGEVPEHWEVRRLKQVVTHVEQGWSPQCDAQAAAEEDWGVLKVGCVNRDQFDPRQNKKLPLPLKPPLDLEIKDGDILVSRANTRELVGLAALAVSPRQKLLLCDKLFRFRAQLGLVDPRFVVFTIRSQQCRAQIECATNGASDSMQNIGQDVIRNLWIQVPPVAEQARIVEEMVAMTGDLTKAIVRSQHELDLIREYRTRLVADVVTGKLDVRGVELPQLGEAEDLPALADEETNEAAEEETELEPVEEGADAAE